MDKVAIEYIDNYRLDSIKIALQKSFEDLGYPKQKPLSPIIHPGDKVFIKPNWVASRWRESCPHKDSLYCVITHPNIIEGIADYVADALQGKGEIIIGDNPSIDADFDELIDFTQIRRLESKYSVPVSILDLRPLYCDDLKNYGKKDLMVKIAGDPKGSVEINLGKNSLLYGIDPSRFRGVFEEREETIRSHTGENQLYTFSRSIWDADVYISIPKMKTHQKVGATLNLKGLVGCITNKNQLVHWQVGYPEINGDEYPDKESYYAGQTAKVKHRGAWPGNDTIWRMVVDLYNAFVMNKHRTLSIVDGIVAGEGQGPFCTTSKNANSIIVGEELLAADCVTCRYMGFAPNKIAYLRYFIENGYKYESIQTIVNGIIDEDFFMRSTNYLDFYVMNQWENIKYIREGDVSESSH